MIKKLILLGFALTLLIGLPLALFVLQQQTQPTTKAAAVTTFSFDGPTTVTTGAPFSENLTVDPGGQNQVSFVKFTFTYDPTKISQGDPLFNIDTSRFTILASPSASCTGATCTVTGTISIGTNQSSLIKSKTAIMQFNFNAVQATDTNNPTQLLFVGNQNQALSVGSADQPAENVFQSGTPLSITISDQGGGTSPTPSVSPTPTGTGGGNGSGTGGSGGSGTGGSGGTGGTGGALSVNCTSFTAQPTSGNPPLVVTFTTVGQSSNDSIARIDLNYGDGGTDTVATGSGIGTGNVNNQITHTYATNGLFTAQALLTTIGGATNTPSTCKTTIAIGTAAAQMAANGGKLPPTGPGQTILLVGALGALVGAVGFGLIFGL